MDRRHNGHTPRKQVKCILIISAIMLISIMLLTPRSQAMSDFICPKNITEVRLASINLGCGQDKYNNSQYLCLPNIQKTALVELCYDGVMGIIVKGNCLETSERQIVRRNCSRFKSGCPDNEFNSKDIYKYPACHKINTEYNCYLAEPNCPSLSFNNSTSEKQTMELSTSTNIKNTTEFLNDTIILQEAVSESIDALVWVTSSIFVCVFAILLMIGFIRRRRINCAGETDILAACPEECEMEVLLNGKEIDVNKERERENSNQQTDRDASLVNDTRTRPYTLKHYYPLNYKESEAFLTTIVGDYSVWETGVSGSFIPMGCDQICMLFCFLCCESGTPDFTKQECLDILNEIRAKAHMHLEVIKREQAQKSLDDLKRAEPNFFEKDFQNITRDATDEILYRLIWEFKFSAIYLCNYHTIHMFLRLSSYEKEPEEKCVLNKNQNFDSCLIHRLQLDILTHKTIKDTDMCNEISQILHVPGNIIKESKVRREEFVRNLQQCGEKIYDRSRTHHKSQHVKWLKKYYRLKTVRSCIGLHHHSDIYIINTQAYREHSVYHDFSSMERCLIYSLLFAEEYKIKLNHDTSKRILTKIRDAFFPKHSLPRDNCKMPKPIVKNKNGELTFISADIRHKVMYAFVTECLIEDDDLEFFLTEAPKNVIFEYCRSWNYKRKDGERCLYVPTDMYDRLIEKLDLDIIKHCTLSDWTFQNSVAKKLNVPLEILNWHQKVREQYVEYARKETHTVHHSRCMLVGCAGAGKTTLLKRLLKHSEDNILHVTTTEGLEIHEDILEISGEFFKATVNNGDKEKESTYIKGDLNAKRLTVFDFGGQSIYYACHQIYLTRKAFYIVVVDASQELHQKASGAGCRQDEWVFSEWTFGDYFVFWLKSIHQFCATENKDEKPIVLIVATHWEEEQRKYKNKEEFLNRLKRQLPQDSDLEQYIEEGNCYCIEFPIHPITELEKRIATMMCQERWKKNIPKEWAIFGLEIDQKKNRKRILDLWDKNEILTKVSDTEDELAMQDVIKRKQDMLQYYHDAGKVLYLDENYLKNFVVLDVQWFVNAFKIMITDNPDLRGIFPHKEDYNEFYNTGFLRDSLLIAIWNHEEQRIGKAQEIDSNQALSFSSDSGLITCHKDILLRYMQSLGLVAVGEKSHYIPCMNSRGVKEEISKLILNAENETSILTYRFDILPCFFFFRLVVACMQEKKWEVVSFENKPCLYKNAALFHDSDYNIILSMKEAFIQLQVFSTELEHFLEVEKIYDIQRIVEEKLDRVTKMFHQKVLYTKDVWFEDDEHNTAATGKKINIEELKKYWFL